MDQPVHIVQKQRYEIKTRKQKTALDMQNRIDDINTRYISPLLAESLDKYFPPDEVTVIDKVELDLENINIYTGNDEWADKFFVKLNEQLRSLTVQNENKKEERSQHVARVWIWFLKYGILPQESFYNSVSEIKNEFATINDSDKEILRSFLIHETSEEIIQRFVANTGIEEKKFHLQLFFSKDIKSMTWQIENEIGLSGKKIWQGKNFFSQLVWQDIFSYMIKTLRVSTPDSVLIDIKKIIKESINKLTVPDIGFTEGEKESSEKDVEISPGKEENEKHIEGLMLPGEIFISNAGLCLLAPWIGAFFKQLKLTTGDKFTDKWKQQHAVYLLHYLITTEENPTEELLVFSKLLCGWPLQMPVINSFEITEEERKECEDLLTSMIQNWDVLKNTSINGLRESFLQRAGKLIEHDDYFVIQPEQQSIDLLLEYISWNFHYIRLPWMKKTIKVEWY